MASKQSEFLVPLALIERLLDAQESERVTFRQTLLDILDRQQEMIGHIHHYQVAAHAPATPAPDVPFGKAPKLYTSEDEEDLRYQYDSDQITAAELERALAEMDYMNSEIDIS